MKKIVPIKGMHCNSCEAILEESISKVEHVRKVRVNHKKEAALIEYDSAEPSDAAIERAVEAAGYSVGAEKKPFFSRKQSDYAELLVALSLFFALFMALRAWGLGNLGSQSSISPSLFGVLTIGLTAGISTCMALIGGLILGISSRHAELYPDATPKERFRPHLFFNAGRLASYAVFGGIVGLIGSSLRLSSPVLGGITLVLGFVMILLGLKLVEIFPRLRNKTILLPRAVLKVFKLDRGMREYSHAGAFTTGALTFFVPCGFTQAMQLYAMSTGSFVEGALIMGIFALGTLPGIIGIGGLTSFIKGAFARFFFKFAGIVVIFLGVWNVSSGYNLLGISLPGDRSPEAAKPLEVELADGKQIIEMTQSAGGYSPRSFTVKKGIPVVWKITSTSIYTCAAYISLPAMGISQPLSLGENTIEFTPEKAGTLTFTCSMGMYTGKIKVVD